MAKQVFIQVKEFPKGIENITAINWAHEDLKAFVVDLVSVACNIYGTTLSLVKRFQIFVFYPDSIFDLEMNIFCYC